MAAPRQERADEIADRRQLRAHGSQVEQEQEAPPETIFLKAGEKFPDLKTRNEETPKSEWVEGFNGKPKGPLGSAAHRLPGRSGQHRPVQLSHGHHRRRHCRSRAGRPHHVDAPAARQRGLSDRAAGDAVHANEVRQGRLRPHFEIVDWTKFDSDSGGAIPASERAATADSRRSNCRSNRPSRCRQPQPIRRRR